MKFHIAFAAICGLVAMASAEPSPTYPYSYSPYPYGSYRSYPFSVYGGGGASGNGVLNDFLGNVGETVGDLATGLLGNGYSGNNAIAFPVPVPVRSYGYGGYPSYYPNYGYGYGYPRYNYPKHY